MPARSVLFADYATTTPKPKRVYCDANFALNVLSYLVFQSNPRLLHRHHTACHTFYQNLKTDNVDIIASLLTYVEVMHAYAFKGPGGMYKGATTLLATKGVRPSSSGPECFKEALRRFPLETQTLWVSIRDRVAAVDEFFGTYMRVLSPLPSPTLTNITKSVSDFASILKFEFVGIESSDALHLSLATYLASDAVVSLDKSFQAVDSFTVYWTP
jgi:predicted nucleic acid-binding protein